MNDLSKKYDFSPQAGFLNDKDQQCKSFPRLIYIGKPEDEQLARLKLCPDVQPNFISFAKSLTSIRLKIIELFKCWQLPKSSFKSEEKIKSEGIKNGVREIHEKPTIRLRGGDSLLTDEFFRDSEPKSFWAITKINVYPDNSTTYEIMRVKEELSDYPTGCTDSIIVVIPGEN